MEVFRVRGDEGGGPRKSFMSSVEENPDEKIFFQDHKESHQETKYLADRLQKDKSSAELRWKISP